MPPKKAEHCSLRRSFRKFWNPGGCQVCFLVCPRSGTFGVVGVLCWLGMMFGWRRLPSRGTWRCFRNFQCLCRCLRGGGGGQAAAVQYLDKDIIIPL